MLTCFLQLVQNVFDIETTRHLWKVLFLIMDIILLGVIPLALLKDLCCQKTVKKKKRFRSGIVTVFAVFCFGFIFLVDVLIFNTYIGTTGDEKSSGSFFENLLPQSAETENPNASWYDITLN